VSLLPRASTRYLLRCVFARNSVACPGFHLSLYSKSISIRHPKMARTRCDVIRVQYSFPAQHILHLQSIKIRSDPRSAVTHARKITLVSRSSRRPTFTILHNTSCAASISLSVNHNPLHRSSVYSHRTSLQTSSRSAAARVQKQSFGAGVAFTIVVQT
jgi:hypothetical protein